jgi:hypothetical protein
MRDKKDSAIGVKFQSGNQPPDSITNMEGAMHTFVTPVVLAFLHGDYRYSGGHGMIPFDADGGMERARKVLVSAAVQPDFEKKNVMLVLCSLQDDEFNGLDLGPGFTVLDVSSKQDPIQRARYDTNLKRHMVAHLTQKRRLPGTYEVEDQVTSIQQAISVLELYIKASSSPQDSMEGRYVRLVNGYVVALELLFNSALHQLRNEFSILEAMCPQGYIYTSDPPVIFAQQIDPQLLNRLQFAALKDLSSHNHFSSMKGFAFNDYADASAVNLIRYALVTNPHIQVVPKTALFQGSKGMYKALSGTEGCLLVIHNNSDAFGQNIESEWASGSLDGAIGSHSSTAASLLRDRTDLLDHVM